MGNYCSLADLAVGSEVCLNGLPATSADVRAHVIAMRHDGKKVDEVSHCLGIAASTVSKLARKAGLRVRARGKLDC